MLALFASFPTVCVQDRLYATYFAGDATFGLPADEEAKAIWKRFLPEERILPFDKKVRGREGVFEEGRRAMKARNEGGGVAGLLDFC